jgi:hypothetical protein
MIKITSGRMCSREYVREWECRLRSFIEDDGLNPRTVDDLYEIVQHPNLNPNQTYIRINVMLPLEVQEQCNKIDRRRKNLDQKEADIEAAIIAWSGANNANPLHAVFIGPSAVLFFGDKKDASIAHLFMSEFISDFKEFYPSKF